MDPNAAPERLPAELRRERLVDIERRLARHRRVAFVVLAIGLLASGPWLGWWWLVPLGVAAVAFAVTDRLVETSRHPFKWAAAGWAVSPLMIAVSVALTGGPDGPAIGWFALPALTLAARFERRGVAVGVLYILGLLLLSTVAVDPSDVMDDPTRVMAAVSLMLAAVILSGAVVQSEREHRRDAALDPLTGLLNRASLANRLAEIEQQAASAPHGAAVGVVLGDLDRFKRINDLHGHAAGDNVLRDVAYAMREELRAFDLVYRVGGEEFLVLLPGADLERSAAVAERLRAAVSDCSRSEFAVTMSLGVSSSNGRPLDFGQLWDEADGALYAAKAAGRDCVRTAAALADPVPV